MNKTSKKLLFKALSSKPFYVINSTVVSIILAIGVLSDSNAVIGEIFGVRNFKRAAIFILIVVFAVSLSVSLIKTWHDRIVAKMSGAVNEGNMQINSVVFEQILFILDSGELKEIIRRHTRNLAIFFQELLSRVDQEIDNLVTTSMLNQFERIKDDPAKQKDLMKSMLSRLNGFNQIEDFIRKEHKECLDELEKKLKDWLESNETLKNIYSGKRFTYGKRYSRREFRLDLDNVWQEMGKVRSTVGDLSIGEMLFGKNRTKAGGMVGWFTALGLTGGLLGELVRNYFVEDELAEAAAYEVFENIGATIPMIGPAVIVFKIFRYLYKYWDQQEKLEELKIQLKDWTKAWLNSAHGYATSRMEDDCNRYLNTLVDRFKANFERARLYTEKARRYP